MDEFNLFNQDNSRTNQHPLNAHRPFQFDGDKYNARLDQVRLTGQLLDIYNVMSDQRYYTVSQLRKLTGHPENSISAQIRNLRKEKFGGYTINTRRATEGGLYEYQLITKKVA